MQQQRRFRNRRAQRTVKLLALLTLLVLATPRLVAQAPGYFYAHQFGVGGGISDPIHDRGQAIVADGAGNVYVTGSFNGTIDFDPGVGVAALTSTDNPDAFVAKYDANGAYLWAFRLGATAATGDGSEGRGIDIDASGNIVVTGAFSGSGDFDPGPGVATRTTTSQQTFVAKYTDNGGFLWAFVLAAWGPSDVEFDPTGNVYVVGAFSGTVDFDPGSRTTTLKTISPSTFVAKYSPGGSFTWVRKLGASGKNADWRTYPNGVSCDATGNVILCGAFNGTTNLGQGNVSSQGGEDPYVAKYSASGSCLWAFSLGGHNSNDVAVDSTGDVYLTGAFSGTVDFDPGAGIAGQTAGGGVDIYLAKYSAAGVYQWASGIGGSGSDIAHSVIVDAQDNVLIAGHFTGTVDFDPGTGVSNVSATAPNAVPYVARYTPVGALDWVFGIDGTNGGTASAVVSAGSGVAVTGYFSGTCDFDHSEGTASLTSAGGVDIFVAGYGQSMLPRVAKLERAQRSIPPTLD